MKQAIARLLAAALLCGALAVGASAVQLQSFTLSQQPLGTEPVSISGEEDFSAYLVPAGTRIQNSEENAFLVEVYAYQADAGLWSLTSLLSGRREWTVPDGTYLYRLLPSQPDGEQAESSGLWVKAPSDFQPTSVTGEPVDEWALNLVNQAIADGLMPGHLQGQDLREPITRLQFAALAVKLYEAASGETLTAPSQSPFSDTSDREVLKAYSMGFAAGLSDTSFGPEQLLTREQAAVMLTAVCRALGMNVTAAGPLAFSDSGQVSPWAQASAAFLTEAGILSGYTDGRFGPQDSAQRQACLIMALRIYQSGQNNG